MLISPIDRNKEPDPEKQISRINSPYWTLPINGGLGSPQRVKAPHSSEGMILRVRDTRLRERRKNLLKKLEPERRKGDNRKHDFRWNSDSHHILVIAIERQPGEPEIWKNGDRVNVVPKVLTPLPRPQENAPPAAEVSENQFSLLTKDDEDYVVHLSGKSPTDINENNR
jgi:hypothetical protein